MPIISVHQSIASKNKAMLDRLLSYENIADDTWILVIAYYEVLHCIELAADNIEPNKSELRSHTERLKFLEHKSTRAKRYFSKLYVISRYLLYGVSLDTGILEQAEAILNHSDFRKILLKWVAFIKEAVRKN